MSHAPAIALIPGFLGFDHKDAYTYFADRFVAALQTALLVQTGLHVPVVAISTLPIASLRARQERLLEDLHALEADAPWRKGMGARAWHLLGHSTGGLDAALLLREHPLATAKDGSVFAPGGFAAKDGDLVSRIASATSISAPHFGTALAECPLAKMATGRSSPASAFQSIVDVLSKLPHVASRDDLASRFGYATGSMPPIAEAPQFLWHLFVQNDLAKDLRPVIAGALSHAPLRTEVKDKLFSIITIAPEPAENHQDQLFLDLWRWTAEGNDAPLPNPPAPAMPLRAMTLRMPSQAKHALPSLDSRANDGVVSSLRQAAGQPIGVVIGDHADVLGRYRRVSPLDGKPIDAGLLTSGASFDDTVFFEMVERIARNTASVL